MKMKLLTLLFVFSVLYTNKVHTAPKSGPYDLIVSRCEACDDMGTDEIHFGTKMSRKDNKLKTYTNDVVFLVPWDDTVKLDLEGQFLRNGAYVPKYMTQSFKTCERARKTLKHLTEGFFGAAGYNFTSCPLPAGTYQVKDWVVDLKLDDVPSIIYGSYKILVTFSKKGKRLGCLAVYLDVVPKETV
ncbi:uncharacterized protein LOC128998770 [Macrosteles quadrilineatus]|uniref:uncharacterized protein LOC128998770 n=1 Tax=Macrosteles quadrilineatus TaxID=74068 RepID=UPI0023E17B91|nr:uncharacterized protein LOC128998770 [Macrosteles quadrilineatus]